MAQGGFLRLSWALAAEQSQLKRPLDDSVTVLANIVDTVIEVRYLEFMKSPSAKSAAWRVSLEELSCACRILSHHLQLHSDDNRRVQWDLQPRVIRYYTTLGLLDRACEKRGKVAYYGARHLYQLLVIKRLQSQGRSLAEIQALMLGATDESLLDQLELPVGWLELVEEHQTEAPSISISSPAPEDAVDRAQSFWATPTPRYQPPIEPEIRPETAEMMVRVTLHQGVEVLIPMSLWQSVDQSQWSLWFQQRPEAT